MSPDKNQFASDNYAGVCPEIMDLMLEANALFVAFPSQVASALQSRGWHFYTFIGGGARLMCSWASTEEGVLAFVQDVKDCLARRG